MNKDQNINNCDYVQNGQCYAANNPTNGEGLYPSLQHHNVPNQDNMQQHYAVPNQPPSYDEIHQGSSTHRGSRFGLIRGYHQQMYEPVPQPLQCCDCSGTQKHGKNDSRCNWGVICGILLLILGVLALTMGFTLPQKTPTYEERRRLSEQELKDIQRIEFYVEVFIITGLTVLSLGGIVISAGILYPLCRKGRDSYDESYLHKYYTASEVYVKREDITPSNKQIVNFGFHKDVVPTDVTLRKIQPERQSKQPIDSHESLK